jgi:hypothetical protein
MVTKVFLRTPWIVWTFVCSVIAFIYYFIWPSEARTSHFLHHLILRYGHTFVWILLAIATVMASNERLGGLRAAEYTAKGSLAVYVLFILAFVLTKI